MFPTVVRREKLQWRAKEVVRDLDDRPHLLTRLTLEGGGFPQRSAEPYVRVGRTRSRFVLIDEDGQVAHAYFDRPLPAEGVVEFGYGQQPFHRFPAFDRTRVAGLDRDRLPAATVLPD